MIGERLAVRLLNTLVKGPAPPRPAGIVLGNRVSGEAHPVILPDAQRCEHLMALGKTGVGKTHAFECMASQHFLRKDGFVWFDYHGDPTEHLVRLAASFPDAANRTVLVDLTDSTTSPGLNPLELTPPNDAVAFRVAAELSRILKQRWKMETFGARTEELLRNTLYTLAMNRQTLIEAPLLLTSQTFRYALVAALPNEDVVAYWRQRYEPLSEAMKGVFREPLLNKITAFLADPVCRHLLGQVRSTINFPMAMRDGLCVLINLAKGKLGEHAYTLGNLIFARLQFDIMARTEIPEQQRRVFSIFCDEVQNLAENDLVTLLAEGRKFATALVTANQFWYQLPVELRGALLSAGTHMLFRLSAADARVLASELSPRQVRRYVEQLTNLARGEAIVRIGWAEPERIRVRALPGMAPRCSAAVEALRARALARVARERTQIEAAIQGRRRGEGRPETAPVRQLEPLIRGDREGQKGW